jgi:hypothetical protein
VYFTCRDFIPENFAAFAEQGFRITTHVSPNVEFSRLGDMDTKSAPRIPRQNPVAKIIKSGRLHMGTDGITTWFLS